MKYQIFVHVKDESCKSISEYDTCQNAYKVIHKGIYNTISEGLDEIFDKFEQTLKKMGISQRELGNYMNITRIDPDVCYRYEKLFLNKK